MSLSWKKVSSEAKLLLIGIPVLIWTLFPLYHMVLFAISPRDTATSLPSASAPSTSMMAAALLLTTSAASAPHIVAMSFPIEL